MPSNTVSLRCTQRGSEAVSYDVAIVIDRPIRRLHGQVLVVGGDT